MTPSAFPPVRACLFDMDGLLINTEDLYTKCASIVLERYGRPPLPWSVKARMMGVPGSSNGDTFHAWARLPISREQFRREQAEQQRLHFPECRPLPGVERLFARLGTAAAAGGVRLALATSSMRANLDLKTQNPATAALIDRIPPAHRVLGDDPRVRRGKPAPDIYLRALACVNEALPPGVPPIAAAECLVFEDSVVGVEAGRRAGMRVVWVPHPALVKEYAGREAEVLAGRIGLVDIGGENEGQLGQLGDGWAEQLPSLEDFPYERYGIIPQED
ncbi:putative gs1-like protein [Rosellinia necatrix]|uniref:Putative gs1-like protein n=1 Tax=Rosellinia necatrix TaxID=77044 RepID=A0A1W2TT64_ROSNE|nr:putative gs1-like protein [Rosellinia necatrix]